MSACGILLMTGQLALSSRFKFPRNLIYYSILQLNHVIKELKILNQVKTLVYALYSSLEWPWTHGNQFSLQSNVK